MVKLSGRPMTKEATSGRVTVSSPKKTSTHKNATSVTEMSTAERRQFYLDHFAKLKLGPNSTKLYSPIDNEAPKAVQVIKDSVEVSTKKDVRSMNTTERRQFYLDHFSPESTARKSRTSSIDKHRN